jgi:bacillolysin
MSRYRLVFGALFFSTLLLSAEPIRVQPLPQHDAHPGIDAHTIAQPTISDLRNALLHVVPARPQLRTESVATPRSRPTAYAIGYRANGTPRQLRPRFGAHSIRTDMVANPLENARAFLRANRDLLRIDDPDRELIVEAEAADALGGKHIRFAQQWRSVPVWPAEMIVHLDAAGEVELVDGAYVPSPRRLSRTPAVSAERATRGAIAAASNRNASAGPAELIVHARNGRRPRLAWKMTVSESLVQQWIVVVDAMTGAVLQRYNNVKTAAVNGSGIDLSGATRTLHLWQDGATFFMLDTSKAMFDPTSTPPLPQNTRGGIFVSDFVHGEEQFSLVRSNSPTSWPTRDSVSAAFWLGQTYDYYLGHHGRNSIDGDKGTIAAAVRYGSNYFNAFWVDEQQLMVFGDAQTYAASLDVIAHEMTHGVTHHSANLVYEGQSGALNEAISDIFGEMAEAHFYGTNDWQIGSQIGGAIRSMSDPGRFHDPAKMSQFIYTAEDNGGVHTNSGIINRAFYLLAEGMAGAIGRGDAEKIFYRALTQHLTKDSQFIDARIAAITSAQELFGPNSNQAAKTAAAFDGVEIFAASQTPDETPIPVVTGSDATLFLFFDGNWFLGRREGSDPADGVQLSEDPVSESRPGVTGDGTIGVFVSDDHDVCLIPTNAASGETCADFPSDGILVSSVGISPDGTRFGFVLLGPDEETPEDLIYVIDLATDESAVYDLSIPTNDGEDKSSVKYADAMTFTADGRFLVYDALNEVETTDGAPWSAWSIYALDVETADVFAIVPAVEGIDIGFPALGHTSDDLLTFEAYDPATDIVTVLTAELDTGTVVEVGSDHTIPTAPSFTGDDRAVIYAITANNATGANLVKQNLAADHLTPTGGRTAWIDSAAYGVAYRRGTYQGPTTVPGKIAFSSSAYSANEGSIVTITVLRTSGNNGPLTATYTTANGTAIAGVDYTATSGTLSWADGDDDPKTFLVRIAADQKTESGETIKLTLNGSSLGTPSTSTITIANVKTRRRGSRH